LEQSKAIFKHLEIKKLENIQPKNTSASLKSLLFQLVEQFPGILPENNRDFQ